MPSNNAEYQKKYRQKNKNRMKEVSVGLPIDMHREFRAFARKQNMSLAALMRTSTDLQIRNAQFIGKAVEEELRELRFLISNISNNVNQMARHSNQLRQVMDENEVYKQLHDLEKLITQFVNTRLKEPL